jgi:hydroxyethylthiazole kinase-like sugar kinase family protein
MNVGSGPTSKQSQSPISAAARAAKAARRVVLGRVRAQRAQAQKKTVQELIHAGAIIRGSDLKKRYTHF